jgi:hypothetical protein
LSGRFEELEDVGWTYSKVVSLDILRDTRDPFLLLRLAESRFLQSARIEPVAHRFEEQDRTIVIGPR